MYRAAWLSVIALLQLTASGAEPAARKSASSPPPTKLAAAAPELQLKMLCNYTGDCQACNPTELSRALAPETCKAGSLRRKLSCEVMDATEADHAPAEYVAPLPAAFPEKEKRKGRRFTHFVACFQGSNVSVATFMACVLGVLCVSSGVLYWRRRVLRSQAHK